MAEFQERRFPDLAPICSVRRHSVVGLPGYDLLCDKDHAPSLLENLRGAGADAAGPECYNALRIEAGTPAWGS